MAGNQSLTAGEGGKYYTIEASAVRQSFREVVDRAAGNGQRIVITRHGRPVAGIVSMRDLDQLGARDAIVDRHMIENRRDPAGTVSFDAFAAAALADESKHVSPQTPVEDHMSFEHLAGQVAQEFMNDFLGPQVIRQAEEQALQMIRERLGDDHPLNIREAWLVKKWVLEALWSHALQKQPA